MLDKISSMVAGTNDAQKKRRRADELRDARKYFEAAEAYGTYLADFPNDFDIWVQRGNCLKDCGSYDAAALAYERAIQINAKDADVYLQMGHLMKLRGLVDAAVDAYGRALDINPRLAPARAELTALGVNIDVPPEVGFPRRYIDLSDVFFYIRHHATLSGIQRVQIGIAEALINGGAIGDEYEFVTASPSGGYVTVDSRIVLSLILTLANAKVEIEQLQALADRASVEGSFVVPGEADTVVILGAFWVMENVVEQIVAMKRRGARVAVLIHDIIPITHPEFCETSLTDTFNMYVNAVMRVVDLALFISNASCKAMGKLLEDRDIPRPMMRVLPNAHLTWKKRSIRAAIVSDEVREALEKPYVLYVSTIEVRKNHTLLFRVWKRLIEEKGVGAVPTLVFVGRPGWRVRDLMDQIESTKQLYGKIAILHDVTDVELQKLYEGALFTTFTSFVEGWGLPVGESLAYGRPCIASNASSIPEVAGELVDYIDPYSLDQSYGAFARMIDDGDYREARAQAISKRFKPRTWNDVAYELRGILSDALPVPEMRLVKKEGAGNIVGSPTLPSGVLHRVGHADNLHHFINMGLGALVHLMFDVNWYPVENFGRWLKNRRGEVAFRVSADLAGDYVVYLGLCTAAWFGGNDVILAVNGQRQKVSGLAPATHCVLKVPVRAAGGIVQIEIRVAGKLAEGADPRKDLCIGIQSIGYAEIRDVVARQDIIEALVLVDPVALT